MKIRSGGMEILPPEPSAPARRIPNRAGERQRVVRRLKAIVAAHAESSSRIGFPLGMPDLEAVIAALRAECEGLNAAAHLACRDEVIAHLRRSLYEELLGEPSNIFFTTSVSEEVVRYEALPRDFWHDCLDALGSDLSLMKEQRR